MIRGIRYQDGMDIRQIRDTGFGLVEYVFGRETEMEGARPGTPGADGQMTGLSISSDAVECGQLSEAIDLASKLNASYLVIEVVETVGADGTNDGAGLYGILGKCLEQIKSTGLKVYIDNAYSEVSFLAKTIDRLNREAGTECFGACLDTGSGNLLGKNLCGMIEHLGHRIGLLHAGDNDGRTRQCQMPYTFTRGRGELSTDWYGIIGTLAMCGFKGPVVYDIAGLFEVTPACLRPGWYRLLSAVVLEWEGILELEEYLKKTLKAERPEADSEEEGKAQGECSITIWKSGEMHIRRPLLLITMKRCGAVCGRTWAYGLRLCFWKTKNIRHLS
jgi:sugar phosphate isomerase/epimerase